MGGDPRNLQRDPQQPAGIVSHSDVRKWLTDGSRSMSLGSNRVIGFFNKLQQRTTVAHRGESSLRDERASHNRPPLRAPLASVRIHPRKVIPVWSIRLCRLVLTSRGRAILTRANSSSSNILRNSSIAWACRPLPRSGHPESIGGSLTQHT